MLLLAAVLALLTQPARAHVSERATRTAGGVPALPADEISFHTFSSDGHLIGFDTNRYFVSNGTYALRVEFEGARGTKPVASGAPAASSENKKQAAPLGSVTYSELAPGGSCV